MRRAPAPRRRPGTAPLQATRLGTRHGRASIPVTPLPTGAAPPKCPPGRFPRTNPGFAQISNTAMLMLCCSVRPLVRPAALRPWPARGRRRRRSACSRYPSSVSRSSITLPRAACEARERSKYAGACSQPRRRPMAVKALVRSRSSSSADVTLARAVSSASLRDLVEQAVHGRLIFPTGLDQETRRRGPGKPGQVPDGDSPAPRAAAAACHSSIGSPGASANASAASTASAGMPSACPMLWM